MPRRRADDQFAAVYRDPAEVASPGDVDQNRGSGQPQLHHRQQRVAASEQLGVVAVPDEQVDRVRCRVGGDVFERGGNHAVTSAWLAADCAAAASTARTMLW